MLVAILHNAVADDASADERDVLVQVEAVSNALRALGHETVPVPVTLDLQLLADRLKQLQPAVAFNLVEALGGTDRLAPLVPLYLELSGIPFTGCDSRAFQATASKGGMNGWLEFGGIPVPASVAIGPDGQVPVEGGMGKGIVPGRFLLKADQEHASFGMDDTAIIDAETLDDVADAIRERERRFGKRFIAEQFIDGREFNLSILAVREVLPPAEIRFDAFPPDKPRIVGYAAKWEPESFEYNETPRRFDFPPEDQELLTRLRDLALLTWVRLELSGYARVDFRVDQAGRPYVIEANANPCLSPDAGFAAALANAGIPFDEAVRRILAAAT